MPARKPAAVPDLLQRTLKAYRLKRRALDYAAFPLWEKLVGKEIAAVAFPVKILRRKILIIQVIDAVWAQELVMRQAELLENIRRAGVGAYLEEIRFVTGDPRVKKR